MPPDRLLLGNSRLRILKTTIKNLPQDKYMSPYSGQRPHTDLNITTSRQKIYSYLYGELAGASIGSGIFYIPIRRHNNE